MIAKIVAGPMSFHAFCAEEPVKAHPSMWDELHDLLGPARETREEAENDLCLMQEAMRPVRVEDRQGPFVNLSDDAILALGRIAKNRKKGAYAFFRDPKLMIALREEIEWRKL